MCFLFILPRFSAFMKRAYLRTFRIAHQEPGWLDTPGTVTFSFVLVPTRGVRYIVCDNIVIVVLTIFNLTISSILQKPNKTAMLRSARMH